MLYVLIILALNGAQSAATTAEFYTKEACESARQQIVDHRTSMTWSGGLPNATIICAPKR